MDDATSEQPEGISAAHEQLAALVGRWEGSTRVWFEPGNLLTSRRRGERSGQFLGAGL